MLLHHDFCKLRIHIPARIHKMAEFLQIATSFIPWRGTKDEADMQLLPLKRSSGVRSLSLERLRVLTRPTWFHLVFESLGRFRLAWWLWMLWQHSLLFGNFCWPHKQCAMSLVRCCNSTFSSRHVQTKGCLVAHSKLSCKPPQMNVNNLMNLFP